MKLVAKTPLYEISYDSVKNRTYLKIIGFWRNPEVVPNYLSDFAKMIKMTRRNFTILVDTTQMPVHPKEVQQIHETAQRMSVNAGVARVAHILSESAIAEFMIDKMASNSRMPQDKFRNGTDAEAWLDKV